MKKTIKIQLDNKKASAKVSEELYERFKGGERLTARDIVDEYFDPKDGYLYIQSMTRVKGWLTSLKYKFKERDDVWFGNVNPEGEYGIPDTEGEYRYIMMRYYVFAKGVIKNATYVATKGEEKGLLTLSTEPVRLPRLAILGAK